MYDKYPCVSVSKESREYKESKEYLQEYLQE